MGRPINPIYTGNTALTPTVIAATAWIPGDVGPTSNAWIISQQSTNSYNFGNISGPSSGLCYLTDGGVALTQGTANISVTPYGSGGTAAAASANLGVNSFTVVSPPTSGTSVNYYVPGEVVSPTSGTASAVANLLVETVTLGTANVATNGNGYTVGDTFTWGYAGYSPAAVVTVLTTSANGNVATVSITNAGTVSNVSVTNTTPYSSAVTANAGVSGVTFKLRWDLKTLGLENSGDYSTAPSNPVALTGSTHGAGGALTVGWGVSSVKVTNGGRGYSYATVGFSSGAASALSTVNAAGSITSVSVTSPGSGYTSTAPTVSFSPIGTVQYASVIKNRTVTTFSGNTYEWTFSNVLTASNQATLQND